MSIATLKQAHKLLELVIQKETPSEQLQALFEGGFQADLLDANLSAISREDFRKFLGLGKLMSDLMELTSVVLPEREKTFGDRIGDGGYDWVNSEITEERFPLTLTAGPRQLVLAHFNKVRSRKQVEEWAAENGYEVALIDDLFAVGSHREYKELQRQFPIVALGSSALVHGCRHVPYLYGYGARRYLSLYWDGHDFREYCRFLLVRKS